MTSTAGSTPPSAPQFDLPVGADGWQLYDVPGAEAVAATLSEQLGRMLLQAWHDADLSMGRAQRIRDAMYVEMSSHEGFGTRDTEPETVLVVTIEREMRLSDDLGR